MLKFESLEIIGFKSFCDKTRVVFDDHTTCVIGPNGCGKSNLSDAIAWVLGAQNARTLRSERMEDLIFNGTAKRKPSGLSEITLTIKRTDEKPLLLDGTELTGDRLEITRRLYRSGESAYFINQRRCRLKDIHQFMDDAALGFASYAMIAQGNIETFLSSKPMDRRTIIEEAAGIAGYKSRRKSAELKLELAQQNLLRINDIVVEVERQLRSLKRQAAKARRYRELKDEFRNIQFRKFALEGRELAQRLLGVGQDRERIQGEEETVRQGLSEAQETYRARMETRDKLEKRLTEVRQSLASAHLELDRTQNSIQYHEDQIDALSRRIEMAVGEQEKLGQSLQAVNQELERFRAEEKKLGDEEQSVEQTLTRQKEEVRRYGAEVQSAEQGLERLRSDYVRLSAEGVTLRNAIEQLQQRRALAAARKSRVEKEQQAIASQLNESQSQLALLEGARADKKKEGDRLQSVLVEQERLKSEFEERLAAARREIDELQQQAIACRERLHSLQEVELSHSQYSEGVQKFLNHLEQTRAIRTSGTLAESIEASPEYERLVEEVLDAELEYVLVDSLDEAVRGVSELKNLKGGKCTFLSLQTSNGFGKKNGQAVDIPPNRSEGVHGTLLRLLQMSPEVEQAFKRVLPERAASVVVSDLDRAFALAHTYPEQTFLTLDGESLAPRGLLSATAAQSKKLGLLALKRQKKDLEKKLGQTQTALLQAQKREERTKSEHEAVTASCVASQARIHDLEKETIALEHQWRERDAELRRLGQTAATLNDEIRQLNDEDTEQAEQSRRLEERLAEKAASQTEMDRLIAEAQSALRQLRVEFARVQEQLHMIDSDRKVMGERRLALQRTLERVQEQRSAVEARVKSSQQSQSQDRSRQSELSEELAKLRARLEEVRQSEENLKRDLDHLETDYGQWKQAHPAVERALASLREQALQLQEERSRCEIEQARLETQLENAAEQCLEQLQQPLSEVMTQAPEETTPSAEIMQAYSDLRARLDEFGPINMTALEEYQENETRYEFLTRQKQDIEQSITDTTRAIQEINRRSRDKFREAFIAINDGFKEVFVKLFGGGDCGIQLIGDEDPLEAGIDVYAQPPGKKVQNIMLLSGGEKAMTVLALLVALFHYRPSQFCVLDEVDAPLDDANVGRFAALVKDMSANTQFIVITHNKRTMEIANYIYGVTMEEAGVSQVVSVKF
jgi:chromosome segregation protein